MQVGVGYLWYVDPRDRTLRVSRLEGGKWVELGVHGADEKVRAEPFDAVEIDLAAWWEAFGARRPAEGRPEGARCGQSSRTVDRGVTSAGYGGPS